MKNFRPITIGIFLLGLGLLYPFAQAVALDCNGLLLESPINQLGESGVGGTARLCIDDNGVRGEVAAAHLNAGDAYTTWFVYIDDPSAPNTDPDNPQAVLGRFDSGVPDSDEFTFRGKVRGLYPSSGSVVRIPIFGHGPACDNDNRYRARQLLTPQEPGLGAPHLGTMVDGTQGKSVGVAVFNIP